MRVDDVFVATGGLAFYGDCRVEALFPNAAGALTQFTPNAAGANYTKVNELTPDNDTTYVFSSTPGQEDLYLYTHATPTSAQIKAIQYVYRSRTDDEGTRVIKGLYRDAVDSIVYESPNTLSLTSSYAFIIGDVTELNPRTNAAWTLAQINTAQWGIKIQS
jgi:hypothetical protein